MDIIFNLLNNPWISVRQSTTTWEVSLLDLFRHAHEFDALAAELPTVDVALLRLLLAVLYGALARDIDSYGEAIALWQTLWARGAFDGDAIAAYLEQHRERFWLFHPEMPFYQAADLRTTDGRVGSVAQMIADVPSREERRFFSDASGEAVRSLSFPEAARWLVHLQAWDYAGKKASVVGGAPNGGGPGWCGKLGVVYAEGRNLFETLMLNFVLTGSSECLSFAQPSWEQPPTTAAKREITPRGYTELLTVQSRRAMLVREGERVTGIVASYGDVFDKENLFVEQMSGWRKSSVKDQGYIPNTHSVDRSMWRDLAVLLPRRNEGGEEESTRRPGVVDWVARVRKGDVVNLRAVGYKYGAMMGVVNTMVCDSLTINAAMLGELGIGWTSRITELLQRTDHAVRALATLASDLDKAAGGGGKTVGYAPRERAYFLLDEPFRVWLRRLDPRTSVWETVCAEWERTACEILRLQGEQLTSEAGKQAFTGRMDRGYYINAPIALKKFQAALYKQLKGGTRHEGESRAGQASGI